MYKKFLPTNKYLSRVFVLVLLSVFFFSVKTPVQAAFGDLVWTVTSQHTGDPNQSACQSDSTPCYKNTSLSDTDGFFMAGVADETGLYVGMARHAYFYYLNANKSWISKWSLQGSLIKTVTHTGSGVSRIVKDGSDNIKIHMYDGSWQIRRKSDLALISSGTGSVSPYATPNYTNEELVAVFKAKMFPSSGVYLSPGAFSMTEGDSILLDDAASADSLKILNTRWGVSKYSSPYDLTTAQTRYWFGPNQIASANDGHIYLIGAHGTGGSQIEKRVGPTPPPPPPPSPLEAQIFANPNPVDYGDTTNIFWSSWGGVGEKTCSVYLGGGAGFETNGADAGVDETNPIYTGWPFGVQCTDEDGNSVVATYTGTVTLPPTNLITSAATLGLNGYSAIISNVGAFNTSSGFDYIYRVATGFDGTGTVTDYKSTMSGINSGSFLQTSTFSTSFTDSIATPSVQFCADMTSYNTGGVIIETNEDDNCGSWTNITLANTPTSCSMAGSTIDTYPGGIRPHGSVFDPVTNSVWISNTFPPNTQGSVSKFNVNTGSRVDYLVQNNPNGMIFDPVTNSIWVVNARSNSVSKVNINNGTRVDYPVGQYPDAIDFDPFTNSVWVANISSDSVSKVNVTNGTRVDYPVGNSPRGVAYDARTKSVWVGSNDGVVSKLDINTGARVDYPVGPNSDDIVFDSVTESVWVIDSDLDIVSKVNVNTGTRVDYPVASGPSGLTFDSSTNSLWVSSGNASNVVSKLNIFTGSRVDYPVGLGADDPIFDPVTQSIWVPNMDEDTVTRLSAGCPAPATPTNLIATPSCSVAGVPSVTVSWNAVMDADSYLLQRCDDISCSTPITIATPTGTTFTDNAVLNDRDYFYRVSAVNNSGYSAYSPVVTVKTCSVPSIPASIYGNGCIITLNNSTCVGDVTWDIQSAISPNIYNLTRNQTPYTTLSGTAQPITLTYGPNVIQARDGSNSLAETTLSTICASGTFWDYSICGALPEITITTNPSVIRSGKTTNVTVDVNTNYDLSCTLYGVTTEPITMTFLASGVSSETRTTRNLSSEQIINVSCSVALAPPLSPAVVVSEESRIRVVGIPEEI